MTRRCTGTLIALNHARHVIPSSTLPDIVQALVISIVRYCMSVYGSCSSTQIQRVHKIINFSARVVSGRRKYDRISDVVQRLGWLTACQLVEYHTICAVHSAITTGQPQYIHDTIGPPANQRHNHDTRRANRLTVTRMRTDAGRRRLSYRGALMLNDSHADIGDRQFRANLKRHLLSR